MRRSILIHGLRLVLRSPGALLWTYGFNLLFALAAGIAIRARYNDILSHSLAAQRLTSGFDLGLFAAATERVNRDAPSVGASGFESPVLYLLLTLILVPGALVAFRTGASSRLTALFGNGLRFFGRFLLIALLTAIVSGIILGIGFAGYAAWAGHVDETTVGSAALWKTWPLLLLLFLVASVLRLYFDLVEVYTVALAEQPRPDGKPDRRFYRVLLPAARTLGQHFLRATGAFLLLSAAGLAAIAFTFTTALHTLAQPRTWPMFLLAQLGLFFLLFTRFWQRGAETVLAEELPMPIPVERGSGPVVHPYLNPDRAPLPPPPDFDRATPPPPPMTAPTNTAYTEGPK